jgi:hypothetical protein
MLLQAESRLLFAQKAASWYNAISPASWPWQEVRRSYRDLSDYFC